MKPKVLIVDDTETNIDILMNTLVQDYDIFVGTDGDEALRIAKEEMPDMILLDILMPGKDGYEVCKELKSDEKTKGIPVMFITALNEVQDQTKGFAVGGIDYIMKPFEPPIVLARVKTHIALKRALETLERQNQELVLAAQLREDVERISRHDLKSPLDTIIGFPEFIIEEGNLSQNQIDNLKLIEDAGRRMLNMINLSLDLFKMERGLYQFHPQPMDLIKLFSKIFREHTLGFEIKEIQKIFLLNGRNCQPNDEFIIEAEDLLCYSMFSNLLKNAIEASPDKGQITIHLGSDENKKFVSIHNRGSVPKEIRNKFFKKYTTAGKEGGTGLGAYSARLIAETQKAQIELQTSDETGTTISVIWRV